MSNPYRRPMRERVYKPIEFRSLTGEDVAEHYAELWQFALDDTGGVSESFSDIALRIRHGARAACKRLREERDRARWERSSARDSLSDSASYGYRLQDALAAARLETAEWQARANELEYAAGYGADLAAIDRVLDQHDAPHDCEDGVSLSPKRIRLLAEQRDAARLELRALEWLALHGYPVGRDPDGGRVMAVYREDDLESDWHPSWESAARALGWEG